MDKKNKNDYCENCSDLLNREFLKQNPIKVIYSECLKRRYINPFRKRPEILANYEIQKEIVKRKERWKILEKLQVNIIKKQGYIGVELRAKEPERIPRKFNFIKKLLRIKPSASVLKKNKLRQKLQNNKEHQIDDEAFIYENLMSIQPDYEENLQKDNKFKNGLIDFTAGSIAGVAQVYASQPFDTVKVKQQTFPTIYKNMFHCFWHTYRKDGIVRGLYAGSVPAIIAYVAENSVLFAAYGVCRGVVASIMNVSKVEELPVVGNGFAGCLAAFFSTLTLCPTELVKCKIQAVREMKAKDSQAIPISAYKLSREILVKEGISGLYRGLTPTLVREVPGCFFFFGSYEATRDYFAKPHQAKEDIGPLKTMCAGAVGGIAFSTSTFPADVIKSRIQINNLNSSMWSVGSDILRQEGISAFYNGLFSTIIKTIPASATLFLVYEYTKKVLKVKFE